jgi:hypothetical protein
MPRAPWRRHHSAVLCAVFVASAALATAGAPPCNATQFVALSSCDGNATECASCPSYAYATSLGPSSENTSCACPPGFHASGATFMCDSAPNTVGWLLEERFVCVRCSEAAHGPSFLCEGGVQGVVPAYTSVLPWSASLQQIIVRGSWTYRYHFFYVPCNDSSAASGYAATRCRADPLLQRQGYVRIDASDILVAANASSQLHDASSSWALAHAPVSRCAIYGQSQLFSSSSGAALCRCPANSIVAYNTSTRASPSPMFPSLGSIWNLDVMPAFPDPDASVSSSRGLFFGTCVCAPGFYRPDGMFSYGFFQECLPCEVGFYCPGGTSAAAGRNSGPRIACSPGWTTGSTGMTKPGDCRVCSPTLSCGAGMYCAENDPANYNDADRACLVCPPGSTCPLSRRILCAPGTFEDGPSASLDACKPCPAGYFAAVSGSTHCEPCPPGTVPAQNASARSCIVCAAGTYSPGGTYTGSTSCTTCASAGPNLYQPQSGQAECLRCPAGYIDRNATNPTTSLSVTSISQVCDACPAGKFSPEVAQGECQVCPKDSFSSTPGSKSCKRCPNGRTTISNTSTSESQCICPSNRVQTASGFCEYVGTCMLNEYIVPPPSSSSPSSSPFLPAGSSPVVTCRVCPSCASSDRYADPESMCSGFKDYLLASDAAPSCLPCKTAKMCAGSTGRSFSVLYPCRTGTMSYDTSICVDNNLYRHPYGASCPVGFYEDPYAEGGDQAFEFEGSEVHVNLNNTLIAAVDPGAGVVRIYASESTLQPLQRAIDASSGSRRVPLPPIVHLFPETERTYPSIFKATIDGQTPAQDVGLWSVSPPPPSNVSLAESRALSSCTWSVDGNSLFLVWMDGTVSKIAVDLNQRTASIHLNWSPPPTRDSELGPVWYARFPLAYGTYDRAARHTCVAVPVHPSIPANEIELFRQIQLICSFDFVRDANVRSSLGSIDAASTFGSYLVRIMGDGVRLEVDVYRHAATHASSSLFYDHTFNAIYLSTYVAASYQGRKHVLRTRLTPSYNFELPLPADASVLAPSGFSLSKTTGEDESMFPAGISFDHAWVEPSTGHLLFYAPTLLPESPEGSLFASSVVSMLYFLPASSFMLSDGSTAEPIDGAGPWDRAVQPVSVALGGSASMRRVLSTLLTSYDADAPPRLLFTLYGPLFYATASSWLSLGLPPPTATTFRSAYPCSACPAGTTTLQPGARSIDECQCPQWFYYDYASASCKPQTPSCKAGEFKSRDATPTSDIECLPCPACPYGSYRKPGDCVPNAYRDPFLPAQCVQCQSCVTGYYINPERCDASSTEGPRGVLGTDCIKCPGCKPMETISGSICPGNTLYSTQSCQKCTASCPDGSYISSAVERCSGTTRGSPTDPFDPATECIECQPCTATGQARIGGCTGTLRNEPEVCGDCDVCSPGEYITGSCDASLSLNQSQRAERCAACPPCKEGEYMVRACSGRNLYKSDQICAPCASCARGSYIVPCQKVPENYTAILANVNATSFVLPRPPDAGRCAPCRNCSAGYYISQQCLGTGISDATQCTRCASRCPRGSYMHAPCPGNTLSASTNDCRPCEPCALGEYISSGKCIDGTGATSPTQRTCTPCSSCAVGEYRLAECPGTDPFESLDCAPCQPCPVGTYLARACNGTGVVGSHPDRECASCKTCPRGFYRASGCGIERTISTSNVDDVVCLRCNPCPMGTYLSPVDAEQCPGNGTNPDQRKCIKCPSCGAASYYASGCAGGYHTNSSFTCGQCKCPSGMYIAAGCNGTTTKATPDRCLTCSSCANGNFISVPCAGLGTTSTNRTCQKCTACPAGSQVLSECMRNSTQDRVCSIKAAFNATTATRAGTTTAATLGSLTTTTTLTTHASTTTPAPATTPAVPAPPPSSPSPSPSPPPAEVEVDWGAAIPWTITASLAACAGVISVVAALAFP